MEDPKKTEEYIDSLNIPDNKKCWMKQYALAHIKAETEGIIPEEEKILKQGDEFFEMHPAMKAMWDSRSKDIK